LESYTTEEIIAGLRSQTPSILRYIYINYYAGIKKFVFKSGGSEDDAKDCFQESLVMVYRKIKEDNSLIINSFPDYLFGICRHVYRKQKSMDIEIKNEQIKYKTSDTEDEPDAGDIQKNYEYKLYQYHFSRLGKICRQILEMILQKIPVKDIAEKMGTTEGYIHTRKYKCKEQLISNIKNDPKFGRKYEE